MYQLIRQIFYGFVVMIAIPGISWADQVTSDNVCAMETAKQERLNQIPSRLLHSISMVESGRISPDSGAKVAWPWTINVQGKGFYFRSKQEALTAVRKFQAQGIRSIDVGCMQVNLKHHPDAFANLDEALDPATNVAYAAKFLKSLKEDQNSWIGAIGNYHSATPEFNIPYRNTVMSAWQGKDAKQYAAYRPRMKQTVDEAYLDRFMATIKDEGGLDLAELNTAILQDQKLVQRQNDKTGEQEEPRKPTRSVSSKSKYAGYTVKSGDNAVNRFHTAASQRSTTGTAGVKGKTLADYRQSPVKLNKVAKLALE